MITTGLLNQSFCGYDLYIVVVVAMRVIARHDKSSSVNSIPQEKVLTKTVKMMMKKKAAMIRRMKKLKTVKTRRTHRTKTAYL